jgi:hypothetical protein
MRQWCRNSKFVEEVRKNFDGEPDLQISCEVNSELCAPEVYVRDELQADEVWLAKGTLFIFPILCKLSDTPKD